MMEMHVPTAAVPPHSFSHPALPGPPFPQLAYSVPPNATQLHAVSGKRIARCPVSLVARAGSGGWSDEIDDLEFLFAAAAWGA